MRHDPLRLLRASHAPLGTLLLVRHDVNCLFNCLQSCPANAAEDCLNPIPIHMTEICIFVQHGGEFDAVVVKGCGEKCGGGRFLALGIAGHTG